MTISYVRTRAHSMYLDDDANPVAALPPQPTPVSTAAHTRRHDTSFFRMFLTAGALK